MKNWKDLSDSPHFVDKLIRVPENIYFPITEDISPLTVRSLNDAIFCRSAVTSTVPSLRSCIRKMQNMASVKENYPGMFDDLSAYLGPVPLVDPSDSLRKLLREYRVYRDQKHHRIPIHMMSSAQFIGFLIEIHNQFNVGGNALRKSFVKAAGGADGSGILFPHYDLCRPLLIQLHDYISRNLVDQPMLCATVAFGALVHIHPSWTVTVERHE